MKDFNDPEITDEEFVKQHIPFRELKKSGFFNKEIKRTDYDLIVTRFLDFFGTTKRQWILNQPTFNLHVHPDFITGKMPSTVNRDGELNNNGFKLSL
jgi:hypothetical protein